MVSKASEDLPDPLTPVKTTSARGGSVRSTSLRLCVRAPRTISGCTAGVSLRFLNPQWYFSARDPGNLSVCTRGWPLLPSRRVRETFLCIHPEARDDDRSLFVGRPVSQQIRYWPRPCNVRPASRSESERLSDDSWPGWNPETEIPRRGGPAG